jgi:hypothetical protein
MNAMLSHGQTSLGHLVTYRNEMTINLNAGELLVLRGDQRGTCLICRNGRLWITQENDNQDYFLSSGQKIVILRRGKIFIQGLPQGTFDLSPRL